MKYLVLSAFLLISLNSICQTITGPSYVLKSHETLEVMRVINNEEELRLHMIIRNRLEEGGNFCVDQNTFLVVKNENLKVKQIEGIPLCPDRYDFEYFGESLQFNLSFPPINQEVKIIDVVEDCDANCFWFKGLVIDPELHESILIAYDYYETGFLEEGLSAYIELFNEVKKDLPALEASCIFYIAKILDEQGKTEEYDIWKKKLSDMNSEEAKILSDRLD
jgi:hypothetical protein